MRTKLGSDEQLLLQANRHWVTLSKPFFMLMVALAVLASTFKYPSMAGFKDIGSTAVIVMALYFVYKFYERKFDLWAVTNLRVIDESGVFTRNTKDSPLDRINNVTYEQSFAGLMLGFGDVKVQTAADGDTTISFVEKPKELKDAIIAAQKMLMDGKQKNGQSSSQAIMEGMIECPWCAELIKKKAMICRFCGREVVHGEGSEAEKSDEASADKNKESYRVKTEKLKEMGRLLYQKK